MRGKNVSKIEKMVTFVSTAILVISVFVGGISSFAYAEEEGKALMEDGIDVGAEIPDTWNKELDGYDNEITDDEVLSEIEWQDGESYLIKAGTYMEDKDVYIDADDVIIHVENETSIEWTGGDDEVEHGFIQFCGENITMVSLEPLGASITYDAEDYYPTVDITNIGAQLIGFEILRDDQGHGSSEGVAIRAGNATVEYNEIKGLGTHERDGIIVTNPWNPNIDWNPDHSPDNTIDVTVANNHVEGFERGIYVRNRRQDIDGDEMYQGTTEDVEVLHNTVKNNELGVRLATRTNSEKPEPLQNIDVMYNEIINNEEGVVSTLVEDATELGTKEIVLNYNHIVGNTNWGVNHNAEGTLDATHNWWGEATPNFENPIIEGDVEYFPWYVDEEMNSLYYSISPEDENITAGETLKFTAWAYNTTGEELVDVSENITWSIEDGAGGEFQEDGYYESENASTWNVTGEWYDNEYDEEWEYTTTLTVEPADVDSVTIIEPEDDQVIDAGEELSFKAEAYDQHDNFITDNNTKFTWAYIDEENVTEEEAIFNRTDAGEYDVTASYDGITSDPIKVTVEPLEAVDMCVEPEETTVQAGETESFTAIAQDKYGNEFNVTKPASWFITGDAEANLEYNETAGKQECTVKVVGEWTLEATYSPTPEIWEKDTATIKVEPADVSEVEIIEPEEDKNITAGEELEFRAEAYDEFGNLITENVTDFNWTYIDRFDETENVAIFDQRIAGDYNVSATYGEVSSENITVTVEEAGVDEVIIEPDEDQEILEGETIEFSVEAYADSKLITDRTEDFEWQNATDGLFNITKPGEYNVTAEFEGVSSELTKVTVIAEYELTIEYNSTRGTVKVEEEEVQDGWSYNYTDGTIVNITAIPEEGYYFAEWTGDNATIENTASNETKIEILDNYTIEANFAIPTYYLETNITGEGEIEIDPEQDEYEEHTKVNLTAIPDHGWYFVNWTGDYESEEEEINITMDEDKNITANFEESDQFNLSIYVEGEGSTDPEEGNYTYYEGENVTVKAIPDEGSRFFGWTGDYPEDEEKEEEINITMDEDKMVTAWFKEIPTYELTIEIEGQGQVEVDPEQEEYQEHTEVNLEAIPDQDWYFEEWTGDYESEDEEITVTMNSDKTITAIFNPYEAFFEVEITAHDRNVKEGEYVRVQFRVTNTGEAEGTQDIVFRVEGLEEDRIEDVTLEPGEIYTGEFFWTAEEGSHLLRVSSDDDAVTTSVTVEDPDPAPGFTSLLLVLSAVVAVAIYHKKKTVKKV